MKRIQILLSAVLCICLLFSLCIGFSGCGGTSEDAVIIYSNADKEAVATMKKTLDANGYAGQYIIQSFGTSELGGKLLVEGAAIEADVVTMSSYYIESAQAQNTMFLDLPFDVATMEACPSFYAPILAIQGALLLNTEELKATGLDAPASIADLADPKYAGHISIVDIQGSSTAWLMIQALISSYGEDGAKNILTSIYANAGAHLEQSGSGPIKKVRVGEVAIGFGLRHQAVADKASGLPIDFVDPTEGNFTLTESLAVVDKGETTKPLAMEIARCLIENGRDDLMANYPVPLYQGETAENPSSNNKTFAEKLTVELLEKHRNLSESCK